MKSAPSPVIAPPTAVSDSLLLEQLIPSPHNQRQVSKTDPEVLELAQSIRSLGMLEPILVRLHPQAGDVLRADAYEILAGERRFHAAELAELERVPVRIMSCTELQAQEITVVENLVRKNLTPLEECRGVSMLLHLGRRVDEIAASTGRTEKWVLLRAKVAELAPAWLDAIADVKHPASKLTIGHLELIARMPAEVQVEALAKSADWYEEYGDVVCTIDELRENLDQNFMNDLRAVPWELDDEQLVAAAGSCKACPKRSGCQSQLFDDLVDELKGKKGAPDRCLDRVCFATKQRAFIDEKKAAAEARLDNGQKVLEVAGFGERAKAGQVQSHYVTEAKKGEKGAAPVIETAGKKVGQVSWVKPVKHAPANVKKAFGIEVKADADGDQKPKIDPKAQLENLRREFIARELTTLVVKSKEPPSIGMLVRLTILMGVEEDHMVSDRDWKAAVKAGDAAPIRGELVDWWTAMGRSARYTLDPDGYTAEGFAARAQLFSLALGVDYDDLVASAANAHPDGPPVLEKPKEKAPKAKAKAKKKGKK